MRRLSGSEFQTVGPSAEAKKRQPKVLQRTCGWRLADRRRRDNGLKYDKSDLVCNKIGCKWCWDFSGEFNDFTRLKRLVPDIRMLHPQAPGLRNTLKTTVVVPADVYFVAHVTRRRYLYGTECFCTLWRLVTTTELQQEGHDFAKTYTHRHTQSDIHTSLNTQKQQEQTSCCIQKCFSKQFPYMPMYYMKK